MSLFRRKESFRAPDNPIWIRDPELFIQVYEEIQDRGQADIAGATAAVEAYLHFVPDDASIEDTAEVQAWIQDRFRSMLVFQGKEWFKLLQGLPETEELWGEWNVLVTNLNWDSGALLAWWRLLGSFFEQFIEMQFEKMRPALITYLREAYPDNIDRLIEWDTFLPLFGYE